MRFHVLGLTHTKLTSKYMVCAYSMKTIKFCAMMKSLGHTVFVYGADENEAPCDESIVCATETLPPEQYQNGTFNAGSPRWKKFNKKCIEEIKTRLEPNDIICITAGLCQEDVTKAFPNTISCESGIGYSGIFSQYKVFESVAWMHSCYSQRKDASTAMGSFFDTVIYNSFDENLFHAAENPGLDYCLYIGRMTANKGIQIAEEACKRAGVGLYIAGPPGDYIPEYGEYIGVVDAAAREELMGNAICTLVPTLYVEPFGGVAAESAMVGTPVLTTPWGGPAEYIEDGVDGFKCSMLQEFTDSIEFCVHLDRHKIRERAIKRFSTQNVRYQYEKYFQRLQTLYREGWYS